MEVDMKGSLVSRLLEAGRNNVGSGGFLQYSAAVKYHPLTSLWTLKDSPIDPEKVYHVALADFLMTGGEANMAFLTKDNPEVIKIYPTPKEVTDSRSDSRLAIIRYLLELGK